MIVLFLLIAVAYRYVSLGSIAVAAAFPVLAWAWHEYADRHQLPLIALVSALVIWKHGKNIGRLAAGTEARIGAKSHSGADSDTLGASQR